MGLLGGVPFGGSRIAGADLEQLAVVHTYCDHPGALLYFENVQVCSDGVSRRKSAGRSMWYVYSVPSQFLSAR